MNEDVPKFSGQFVTTRWSVVLAAGQAVSTESSAALEKLCHAYWLPICIFARRKGWNEEDSKDLTQQFFSRLLERNDFNGLDPRRGKFRTFLLASFSNFLANEFDRVNALKRGGGIQFFSLDDKALGELDWACAAPESNPATVYDVRWAQIVLESALQQLKEEMAQSGKQVQFDTLKPFLTRNAGAVEYAEAAANLRLESSSVPVLVHRLRQRFREWVRSTVAQTVSSPIELEEELRHLFSALNQ